MDHGNFEVSATVMGKVFYLTHVLGIPLEFTKPGAGQCGEGGWWWYDHKSIEKGTALQKIKELVIYEIELIIYIVQWFMFKLSYMVY